MTILAVFSQEIHVMTQMAVLHLKDNDFGTTMFEVQAYASDRFFVCYELSTDTRRLNEMWCQVIETFSISNLLDFLKQLMESTVSQVLQLSERGLTDIPGILRQCEGENIHFWDCQPVIALQHAIVHFLVV